jgi:D-serine deaminase-like pyridoxal phosphate-dependent protein
MRLMAGTTNRYAEVESRLAKHDLKDLTKDDLPTPCMVVDLDIFEKNMHVMADHCRKTGIHLRGHVKVHKSPEIVKRQLALGAIGVTCATVAECELLSHFGITELLLTRQPASKNNIGRAVALAKHDSTFGTVVDDPQLVDWLQEAAANEGIKLRVVVDVYAGLSRHGIEAGTPALDLAKKVDASRNLKLIGLMGYAGGAAHTHGFAERKDKSRSDLAGTLETVAAARSAGLPIEIVSGGSTGTYNIDSETKGLTELQAGSYVFMDTLYRVIGGKDDPHSYNDFGMALTVMSTVISTRHPKQCTIDAGNKALLKPTDEVKGRPEVKVENQGAEYGILKWDDSDRGFKLGERVELYPSNLDMSTSVYDRYYIARGERIVDVWPIMGRAGAAQR